MTATNTNVLKIVNGCMYERGTRGYLKVDASYIKGRKNDSNLTISAHAGDRDFSGYYSYRDVNRMDTMGFNSTGLTIFS